MSSDNLQTIESGQDRIDFLEKNRAVAEVVASILPDIRRKGEEITGHNLAQGLRILITETPPTLRDLFGGYRPALAVFLHFAYFLYHYFWVLLLAIIASVFVFRNILVSYLMIVLPVLVFMIFSATRLRKYNAGIRKVWTHSGGLAFAQNYRQLIAIHWPRPARTKAAEKIFFPLGESPLSYVVAHEYAHCLLQSIRNFTRIPAWLDEGFAFWFAEQYLGIPVFRPESRAFVNELESRKDPRALMKPDDERYLRLMARYYWEVRALAEEGKLQEALTASRKELAGLRPKLAVGETTADTSGNNATRGES